jgi:hypothetical protein
MAGSNGSLGNDSASMKSWWERALERDFRGQSPVLNG